MSSEQVAKKRKSFTDIERQKLRAQHQNSPGTSAPALASWFELQFHRKIKPSSVYDILSDKYLYLDSIEATDATRKQRGAQWQDLEDVLFKWWQEEQPRNINGKELKNKANNLWQTIPARQGRNVPSFSDGWLTNWRNRYGLAQPRKAADITSKISGRNPLGAPVAGGRMLPFNSFPSSSKSLSNLGPIQSATLNLSVLGRQILPAPPKSSISYGVELTYPGDKCSLYSSGDFQVGSKRKYFLNLQPKGQHKAKRPCTGRLPRPYAPLEFHPIPDLLPTPYIRGSTEDNPARSYQRSLQSFDPSLWNNIGELFSSFSDRTARDIIIPAEKIVRVLDPFFGAAEEYLKQKPVCFCDHASQQTVMYSEFKNAIGLLNSARSFKTPRSVEETQGIIIEDWFLDFINHDIPQSPSPELHDERSNDSAFPILNNVHRLHVFGHRKPQSRAVISSSVGPDGRIDIWTQTYNNAQDGNVGDVAEQYYANIRITPPFDATNVDPIPQIDFRLAREITQHTSTLLTPIINFSRTRPDDTEIFTIAKFGTSEELQMALRNGKASLNDCDTKGRSLINYALRGGNISTLKYLVTKLDDPNAYEVSILGNSLRPLISLLDRSPFASLSSGYQRAECMKLMLDHGSDASLPPFAKCNIGSIFQVALFGGPTAIVEAILDNGEPFVDRNRVCLRPGVYEAPLCFTAANLFKNRLDIYETAEKIYLLLKRGADVRKRDKIGRNCIQLALSSPWTVWLREYSEAYIEDALLCMITAGAEVDACDQEGKSVSELVCQADIEGFWISILGKSGYDPKPFLSYLDIHYRRKNPGFGVFVGIIPFIRSCKLSFAEHGEQRKCHLFCTEAQRRQDYFDWYERQEEWEEFLELIEEESNSDDEMICDKDKDLYSKEQRVEW